MLNTYYTHIYNIGTVIIKLLKEFGSELLQTFLTFKIVLSVQYSYLNGN